MVTIFSPRGEDIVGVKISSHTGSTQNNLCVDFTNLGKAFQLFLYKDSILPIKEFPL